MAWRAYVQDRKAYLDPSVGYGLSLSIRYYDDANAANIPTPSVWLWTKEFVFTGTDLSAAVVQAAVIEEGKRQRAAMTQVNNAISSPQLTIGNTMAVP